MGLKLNAILGGVIVILTLLLWGAFEHSRYAKTLLQLQTLEALSTQLREQNKRLEVENHERIKTAESVRAAYLVRMHDDEVRLRALQATLTASQSGKVCFRSDGFTTALSGITGLVTEGQAAVIDNRAWRQSWPH